MQDLKTISMQETIRKNKNPILERKSLPHEPGQMQDLKLKNIKKRHKTKKLKKTQNLAKSKQNPSKFHLGALLGISWDLLGTSWAPLGRLLDTALEASPFKLGTVDR